MGKHDYENVRRLMEEVTERINRIENNTTKMMEEKQMETMTKVGIGTACGVAAVITLIASIAIVPVGSTGVVKRMGTVTGATMSEGVHFKMPFITSFSTMSNQIQQSSGDCNATSKDLQAISSTVTVNYHLAPEMTTYVYQNIGAAYTDTLLYPATQETVKAVMAQHRGFRKGVYFMYRTEKTVTRFKETAKTNGVKISEMLSACGLNINTLSSMNNRGSWLQANSLAMIADYLKVSVDYLLGRTDSPTIEQLEVKTIENLSIIINGTEYQLVQAERHQR